MTQSSNNEKTEPLNPTEGTAMLDQFWPSVRADVESLNVTDYRNSELPLARIKKIMKLDDDVKMISSEVPILFAKAAEIFIHELTLRAWLHTEESKRRTLQRNDVAMAISKYEQFDFLIDIVPREESKPHKKHESNVGEVQYILTLPQSNPSNTIQLPNGQLIQLSSGIPHSLVSVSNSSPQYAILSPTNQLQTTPQYIQIAAPQLPEGTSQTPSASTTKNVQVTNTPSAVQNQTRTTPSTHITITAAQFQQLLSTTQKNQSTVSKSVTSQELNNTKTEENGTVEIKPQPA